MNTMGMRGGLGNAMSLQDLHEKKHHESHHTHKKENHPKSHPSHHNKKKNPQPKPDPEKKKGLHVQEEIVLGGSPYYEVPEIRQAYY